MLDSSFCALDPQEISQPIYGTATAGKTVWLLLEVPQPWAARATENNDLPVAVQEKLDLWLAQFPQARLVFVKKENSRHQRRRFFVALTAEHDRRLYRFLLDDISQLETIQLDQIIQDDGRYAANQTAQQLYLVCTNGRRDRCCAKFGLPVYQSLCDTLTKQEGHSERVWQCTHIGGHRYAPVAAALPAGQTVRLEEGPTARDKFLTAVERDRIYLEGYRGRSCFDQPVQAAEYFIRLKTGHLELDHFSLSNVTQNQENDIWIITFNDCGDPLQTAHQVTIRVGQTAPLLASCGPAKLKRQPHYELLDYTTISNSVNG